MIELTEVSGWILDCHQDGDEMVTWVKLDDCKTISLREKWRVALHVSADINRLEQLALWLDRAEMHYEFGELQTRFERHLVELGATRARSVLAVSTNRPSKLKRLAEVIDARGNWHHHELYSVDQKMAQRHLLEKEVHPFGRIKISNNKLTALDSRTDMSLELPPLTIAHLFTDCYDDHGHRTASASLKRIIITPRGTLGEDENPGNPITIECENEEEMLRLLNLRMMEIDPDVLITDAGDSIDLPALRRLSERVGQPLHLSRNSEDLVPRTRGRTAWSYGNLLRKESYHALQGRLHIDMAGSFIVREGGIAGLLELARMSGLSGQDISRLSPGSAISAMQMRQAMEDGVLVPWKKNRPEDVKDGLELLAADRGGLYLEPVVGAHDTVVELDFASLFPSIIATRNISPETMNCSCCDPKTEPSDSADGRLPLLVADAAAEIEHRLRAGNEIPMTMKVPELNLHTCTLRHGFLGRVVSPIIERRMQLKSKRQKKGDVWDGRQNALKWVLVTCFGYTGYRNARFGRIECHEAICAWAREILLQAIDIASEEGWETLHAIVDSMWLSDLENRDEPSRNRSIDRIRIKLLNQIGIPADLEDIYHWICFIPNRTTGVGALTKYFGYGDEGWKVRGIELRQHSTCTWIEQLQTTSLEILKDDPSSLSQFQVTVNLHRELKNLKDGKVALKDLIIARRIRKELGDERVQTIATAALLRAAKLGRRIPPGNKAKFAVVSWRHRHSTERVRLASEIESQNATTYQLTGDVEFYEPLARRAIWAILSPFGWDESGIDCCRRQPLTLESFCQKSESDA